MAMRYTEKDIPNIPLKEFIAALGYKPIKASAVISLYFVPQRDDTEPLLVVNANTNRWYDHGTDEGGDIYELALRNMNRQIYKNPSDFILKYINAYERVKGFSPKAPDSIRPALPLFKIDIHKIRLKDFMKALGQELPVSADGNLRTYRAPYDSKGEPTMIVNIDSDLWRDAKSGAYGSIYDLASLLTGSRNMSVIEQYLTEKMSAYRDKEINSIYKNEQPKEETQKPKPGRKMRF